jgi:asparagine synthase (glutamine-hydrolysing)
MCGIVGVYNLNGNSFSLSGIKNMAEAIAHRGPDGEGYYVKNNIAFGHKRLSILDTSDRGLQPMTSKDGNWTIVFNGAVYNFLELKQELKARGHYFVSGTDTEVIVEGLAEYGTSFFERLNGMFAVGAWHAKEEVLYLSRDRYGVKSLYY